MKKITKAIFPVAGLGTRFLPATKASPKEMLPVVDKPLIQYAVEEAVAAGISDLIFVTGRSKRAIEDHFDKAYELENELQRKGKHDMLESVQNLLPKHVNCIYIRQAEALGLGHAVSCAQHIVVDEPFAVILADDLLDADPPVLKQMVEAYEYYRCSILGVQEIPQSETPNYGMVDSTPVGELTEKISQIVEKPKPENSPSNLAVVGRYVLSAKIFDLLQQQRPGAGGEIQLTDAIATLLNEEQVLAYRYRGRRFDCGSKLGYLQASVEFGLRHDQIGEDFAAWLKQEFWGH